MADDDVRPGFEPRRSDQATPNRGKRRPPASVEGTALEAKPSDPSSETSGDSPFLETPAPTSFDPPLDATHTPEAVLPADATPPEGSDAASIAGYGGDGPATGELGPKEPPSRTFEPIGSSATPALDERAPVEEPSMATAAADLASPDRPAESFGSPDRPAERFGSSTEPPRRSMMSTLLATIGVVLIVLLGANLYMMANAPGQGAFAGLEAKTGGLERRLGALEAKPADTAALGPLDARVKTLEGTVAGLAAAPAPTPATPDPEISAKLSALDAKAGSLNHAVADLTQQVAALPKPDFGPTDAKLADLANGVAALKTDLAATRGDIAPLGDKIAAVDKRLQPIETEFSAPKIATRVSEARQEGSAALTRAAPLAVTAQAVLQALDDGKPFTPALAALQALGTDEAKLAALRPVASTGAPTKDALIAGFADVRGGLLVAAAPVQTGTVFDRMMASAQSVVKVRPAGASPGGDPDAIVSRIDADLSAGAFAAALSEWGALPDASRAASAAWADKLKARVAAEDAARAIATGAIVALGATP